jgi:hypothetical protein
LSSNFASNRGLIFLSISVLLHQGLGWYAKHLRIDEDGDVANKFFVDVSSEKPARFTLNNDTRPVKVKKQVLSSEGKVLQCVEHQGRLQVV